jgi:hypothetical protein
MTEFFSFPNTDAGLVQALHTTLSMRHQGFRTRLATRQLTRITQVVTVLATPPARPNRHDRGCDLVRP